MSLRKSLFIVIFRAALAIADFEYMYTYCTVCSYKYKIKTV